MVTLKIMIALGIVFFLTFMLSLAAYESLIVKMSRRAVNPSNRMSFALIAATFVTIMVWIFVINVQ